MPGIIVRFCSIRNPFKIFPFANKKGPKKGLKVVDSTIFFLLFHFLLKKECFWRRVSCNFQKHNNGRPKSWKYSTKRLKIENKNLTFYCQKNFWKIFGIFFFNFFNFLVYHYNFFESCSWLCVKNTLFWAKKWKSKKKQSSRPLSTPFLDPFCWRAENF